MPDVTRGNDPGPTCVQWAEAHSDSSPITLVVTAHRANFLDAALSSVARQTRPAKRTIIMVDGSGEPEANRVARRFVKSMPRHSIDVLTTTGGSAGRVRNAGFLLAETEWVTYLDGDDVLHPRAIEMLTADVARDDADIISTGQWWIHANSIELVPESLTYHPKASLYRDDPDLSGERPFWYQLLAIRRIVWEEHPFYEGGPGGEDLDFLLHQTLRWRFRKLGAYLYGHRRVADGFSARGQRSDRKRLDEPCTCPCSARYRDGYYERLLRRHLLEKKRVVGCPESDR